MKILVTAFEPFGGETINPSLETLNRLPDEIKGVRILRCPLPVSYARAGSGAIAQIKKENPDAVLCLGQAGGRKGISIETRAVNCASASAPDNDGDKRSGTPLVQGAPEVLTTSLYADDLLQGLREENIPACLSEDAGKYVCNSLIYRVLEYLLKEKKETPAGFVHIPYEDSQVKGKPEGTFSMSLDLMECAVRKILAVIAEKLICDRFCGNIPKNS